MSPQIWSETSYINTTELQQTDRDHQMIRSKTSSRCHHSLWQYIHIKLMMFLTIHGGNKQYAKHEVNLTTQFSDAVVGDMEAMPLSFSFLDDEHRVGILDESRKSLIYIR